jgi:hypothetical protein
MGGAACPSARLSRAHRRHHLPTSRASNAPEPDLDDHSELPCSLRARQLWEVVTSSQAGSGPSGDAPAMASASIGTPVRILHPGEVPERDLDDHFALPCSLRARQLWAVVTLSPVGSTWTMYASACPERRRYESGRSPCLGPLDLKLAARSRHRLYRRCSAASPKTMRSS